MAELLNHESFGDKVYGRFPESYRLSDKDNGYFLKRYIDAMGRGGFSPIIQQINSLASLMDSQKAPSELMPDIYKSYGMDIFHGLPEFFLRMLLPNLDRMFAHKGSPKVIEYLCSLVAGVQCDVDLSEFSSSQVMYVTIVLDMELIAEGKFPNHNQLARIVNNFMPFYCTAVLIYHYELRESSALVAKEEWWDTITESSGDERFSYSLEELDGEVRATIATREDFDIISTNDSGKCLLNSPNSLLGESFYLNSVLGYDKIKEGDRTEIRTHE